MTKTLKKSVSILLSLIMVFSMFAIVPFSVSAAVGDYVPESDYLTFTAEEPDSTVTLKVAAGNNLQYDLNGTGLTGYTAGTKITLQNAGDYVRFSGTDTKFNSANHVSLTGKVACSGNVMSLRLDGGGKVQGLTNSCFSSMFSGCAGLTSAPELPETTLANYCYQNMFSGCDNLTKAPELPATNLKSVCYYRMFFGCKSLTELPELPATNLPMQCYMNMFTGCSNICISDEAGTFNGITYSAEYRIPTTGEGTSATYALDNMFADTGGKFTGTPDINTIYYVPAPASATYTVTWKNWDGTELATDEVKEGSAPTYDGEAPTKAADAQNTYTFSGWSDGSNTYAADALPAVSGDVTYTAVYNSTVNEYTVTWKNDDGSVIDTTTVAYGEVPTHADATKDADAQYTYTFAGWTPELKAVDGDATYTAVYNSTVNEYTVTWKNDDGSVIDTTQVAYGEVPTHADATKDADAQYTYTFAGWSDGSNTYAADALPAVSGDVTYTAVYNSTVNEYTVTWKNEDGSVIDTTQVAYGVVPTHDDPTKPYDRYYYYTFAGWDVEPVAVTGNAEYTATFEQNDIPLPNGPQDDGYYYFFGEKQKAYKLIHYYDDYWYLVAEYNKIAKNQIRYLEAYMVEGTGFEEGFYWFDSEGHMTTLRNGPQFDGYFYLNNERLNAYQLVEHEGEWYYIASGNKYARDTRCYLSSAIVAGTDIPAGYYDFDFEGRLIVKNGLYIDDCYYVDNVRQSAYQLVEIDGDYYYIAENHKIAKGQRRYLNAAVVENTPFAVGYYEFDDLGRMIFKNGPDADGYFYLNNAKQKAYKLIDFEGDYYFVAEYNKYAKNQRRYLNASMVEGTDFAVGYYNFDADGKMILAD